MSPTLNYNKDLDIPDSQFEDMKDESDLFTYVVVIDMLEKQNGSDEANEKIRYAQMFKKKLDNVYYSRYRSQITLDQFRQSIWAPNGLLGQYTGYHYQQGIEYLKKFLMKDQKSILENIESNIKRGFIDNLMLSREKEVYNMENLISLVEQYKKDWGSGDNILQILYKIQDMLKLVPENAPINEQCTHNGFSFEEFKSLWEYVVNEVKKLIEKAL